MFGPQNYIMMLNRQRGELLTKHILGREVTIGMTMILFFHVENYDATSCDRLSELRPRGLSSLFLEL